MASKATPIKTPIKNPAPPAAAKGGAVTRVEPDSRQVATQEDVPDYIKQGKGRGSENVTMKDVVIPRLEIVQMLSPCLKPDKAEYIEGAKVGDLFNSVTREVYGTRVTATPVYFFKQYLVWKDRKKGGGFGGAYNSLAEANERIKQEPEAERALWAAQETDQQLIMIDKVDGTIDECVISMSRTKLKVSRQFNALVRIKGGDRFSRRYMVFTANESNANGDEYLNYAFTPAGFPPQVVYEKAEALYTALSSGARKAVFDHDSGDEVPPTEAGGPTEY